jgi:hypothetical protein
MLDKIFLPAGAKKAVVEKKKLSLLVKQNILKVVDQNETIFLNPLIVVKSENFASILSEHSNLFYLPFFLVRGAGLSVNWQQHWDTGSEQREHHPFSDRHRTEAAVNSAA